MALPLAPDSGGIRFTLFGFPVRLEWSFFLIGVFFGLVDVQWALVWMAVLFPSILVHELGHAFASRRLGAEPTITVYAFGGLTAYVPPQPPTRSQAIGVSLAGPLAGFALGAIAYGLALSFDAGLSLDDLSRGDGLERVLALAVWINLAWGALNLLPVLPLDGGHVMQELLPGGESDRPVRAAAVSVVVAAVAAVLFWRADYLFAAFLMAVFGVQSITVLVASRRHRSHRDTADAAEAALTRLQAGDTSALTDLEAVAAASDDPQLREQLTTLLVEIFASTGRPAEARRVLATSDVTIHPGWYGYVALVEGDPSGCQQVIDAYHNGPNPSAARCLTLACIREGRDADVPGVLANSPTLTPAQLAAATTAARSQHREELARAIEGITWSAPGGSR
ncbi:MAG: site-2 protease family protein [Acidimicrobiales bacterium]